MSDLQEMVAETDDVRVYITPDDDSESPRDWDNLGVMACGHQRYNLGDHNDPLALRVAAALREYRLNVVVRWLRAFHGATVVLPLGLIDHSGISMYVGSGAHVMDPGGWDSGLVGLIFDTPESRERCGTAPEHVEKCLRGEVKTYDRYLTGDVWGYVVEKRETWTNENGDTRDSWEHVDSVWGYYGDEHAKAEAIDAFKYNLTPH